MEAVEKLEVGRIEFEEGTFRQNNEKYYLYISEERIREIIREIIREELADLQQLKDEK